MSKMTPGPKNTLANACLHAIKTNDKVTIHDSRKQVIHPQLTFNDSSVKTFPWLGKAGQGRVVLELE